MPCELADSEAGQREHRRSPAGISRSEESALPELHDMPCQSAWILCGSEFSAMRILGILLLCIPLCAQDQPNAAASQTADANQAAPAQAAPAAAQAPATPAKPDQTPASASPSAPAEPAKPAGEGWLTGSFEVGYRVIPNVNGSVNTYLSVVGLGEGPRLFGADFTIRDPKQRLFDRADVHVTDFGGDPYSTFRVDVEKNRIYRFVADYRNIAYFNFLPSYADPLLTRGVMLNENSFQTHLRTADV